MRAGAVDAALQTKDCYADEPGHSSLLTAPPAVARAACARAGARACSPRARRAAERRRAHAVAIAPGCGARLPPAQRRQRPRRSNPRSCAIRGNGKPHVAGLPEFSIAHAGEWVLCALSSDGAVGVDIEPVVPRAALPRWLTVFDAQERAAARSARAALAIWSTKEAALKAAGCPLRGTCPVCGCAGGRSSFAGGAGIVVRRASRRA